MKQESIMSRLFRMISINSEPQENTETEENQQEENQPLERRGHELRNYRPGGASRREHKRDTIL